MRSRYLALAAALTMALGALIGPLAAVSAAQQYPPRAASCRVSVTLLRPGARVTFTCTRFRGRSPVRVQLFSDPVELGSFMTDADGAFVADLQVPEATPAGEHTLRASGVAPDGQPLVESVPVMIAAASTAHDGAGDAGASSRSRGGNLSRTGTSSVIPLTVAALALIGAGATAAVVGRRQRPADPPQ